MGTIRANGLSSNCHENGCYLGVQANGLLLKLLMDHLNGASQMLQQRLPMTTKMVPKRSKVQNTHAVLMFQVCKHSGLHAEVKEEVDRID